MKMVSWLWKGSKAEDTNQQDLKKAGFDPEQLEVGEARQQAITDFSKDYEGFIEPSPEETLLLIKGFKYFPNDEEPRHELGYSKGGKICGDQKQVAKIRAIGKEMIKLIGKKIISGQFNLTKVSFPIKAMVPRTALQSSTLGSCMFPIYMAKAAETPDPVQKMRFFVTSILSSYYYMNLFLKPLNPVLGETLSGTYSDGTRIYCEQVSHHPPVSYFLTIGPNDIYRFYGYYLFEAKAGLNSMTLVNKGHRTIQFKTGEVIRVNFTRQVYSGVFLGTLRNESLGDLEFQDKVNNIKCNIQFGKTKKKYPTIHKSPFATFKTRRPSDYFTGKITAGGKTVSELEGTYCGYVNIDGVRYWDCRYMNAFKIKMDADPLPSDHSKRTDLLKLKQGRIMEAQAEKQRIEDLQRRDAKMRKHQI